MKTESLRTPEIALMARAEFRPEIEVAPDTLVITEPGTIPDQLLRVTTKRMSRPEGFASSSRYIKAFAEGPAPAAAHTVIVRFDKDALDTLNDEVRLRLRIFKSDGTEAERTAVVPVHRVRLAGSTGE